MNGREISVRIGDMRKMWRIGGVTATEPAFAVGAGDTPLGVDVTWHKRINRANINTIAVQTSAQCSHNDSVGDDDGIHGCKQCIAPEYQHEQAKSVRK